MMHEILFLIVVSACYDSSLSGSDIMDTKLDMGFESYVTRTYAWRPKMPRNQIESKELIT